MGRGSDRNYPHNGRAQRADRIVRSQSQWAVATAAATQPLIGVALCWAVASVLSEQSVVPAPGPPGRAVMALALESSPRVAGVGLVAEGPGL
jgi:hypothetical protein